MGIQTLNNTPTQKEAGPISSEIEPDQSRFPSRPKPQVPSMFAAVFSHGDSKKTTSRYLQSQQKKTRLLYKPRQ